MARVELAPGIATDFDRIFDYLAQFSATDATARRVIGNES
jgi:plasmid stabilization system protein ParE